MTLQAIVPIGATYKLQNVSGSPSFIWSELRE